jgi:hypothetical protein
MAKKPKKAKQKSRNPNATLLREKLFQHRVIPNKKKPEPTKDEDWE